MPEISVVLPKWGMTMQDATLVEWLVAEGDRVEAEQAICVVETDKVNAEVVAPASGVVGPLLVGPDDVVEVGAAMTTITSDA